MENKMLPDLVTLDVETTGLHPLTERVIELAAVRWSNGQPAGEFSSLVNPGRPVPPASQAIHGITDDMLHDAPGMGDVLRRFRDFAGDLPLAAHNAGFDCGFLSMESARTRVPLMPARVLDTLAFSRLAFPEFRSHKLTRLAHSLRIVMRESHRALADALTAGRVLNEAAGRLGGIPDEMWTPWSPVPRIPLREPLRPIETALRDTGYVEIRIKSEVKGKTIAWNLKPMALFELMGKAYVHGHCPAIREERSFPLEQVLSAKAEQQAWLF
jgi:DNA polymerase III epsilon subunit family exonuclease